MSNMRFGIATAWHNHKQRDDFLDAWNADPADPHLFLQQDVNHEGGAITKNKAICRAVEAGCEVIVVLDDDCFPTSSLLPQAAYPTCTHLHTLAEAHITALEPQPVEMFEVVTDPPLRGTPYAAHSMTMPVACSMGFWTEIGDYCAPRQLVHGAKHPMEFRRKTVFGRYFPLCGMNYAFRRQWMPWGMMVEGVGRFDDIWMGFMWQKRAYADGYCFNLAGPLVRHSRQSNVWRNLRDEAERLEKNEWIWARIAETKTTDYDALRALLLAD